MGMVMRAPPERFAQLADWPYEPRYEIVDDLRLARIDEGPPGGAAPTETVLLVHGVPTWSYLYRGLVEPLRAAGHRVVALDHPGFGRSDKPTNRRWYTYDRMVDVFGRHLAALDLPAVTLVVHDWGGPIGLRWAVQNPDRVRRLVLLNTGLYGHARPSPVLLAWLAYARTVRDVPLDRLFAGELGRSLPPEHVAAAVRGYLAPFPNLQSKTAAVALPRALPLLPSSPAARAMRDTVAALGRWERPALVAFSDHDLVFPFAHAEQFAALIPGAGAPARIRGAGHFVTEERPADVAEAILRFLG
jgi:haloalkane dehalogenase